MKYLIPLMFAFVLFGCPNKTQTVEGVQAAPEAAATQDATASDIAAAPEAAPAEQPAQP